MKNHQAHLISTKLIFEVNVVPHNRDDNYENEHSRGRGRGCYRG